MSQTASDSVKKKKCTNFEPQAWRKTLCKNCFRTQSEHTDDAGASSADEESRSRPATPRLDDRLDAKGAELMKPRPRPPLTSESSADEGEVAVPVRKGSGGSRYGMSGRNFQVPADTKKSATSNSAGSQEDRGAKMTDSKPSAQAEKTQISSDRSTPNANATKQESVGQNETEHKHSGATFKTKADPNASKLDSNSISITKTTANVAIPGESKRVGFSRSVSQPGETSAVKKQKEDNKQDSALPIAALSDNQNIRRSNIAQSKNEGSNVSKTDPISSGLKVAGVAQSEGEGGLSKPSAANLNSGSSAAIGSNDNTGKSINQTLANSLKSSSSSSTSSTSEVKSASFDGERQGNKTEINHTSSHRYQNITAAGESQVLNTRVQNSSLNAKSAEQISVPASTPSGVPAISAVDKTQSSCDVKLNADGTCVNKAARVVFDSSLSCGSSGTSLQAGNSSQIRQQPTDFLSGSGLVSTASQPSDVQASVGSNCGVYEPSDVGYQQNVLSANVQSNLQDTDRIFSTLETDDGNLRSVEISDNARSNIGVSVLGTSNTCEILGTNSGIEELLRNDNSENKLLQVESGSNNSERSLIPARAKVETTITLSGVGTGFATQVQSDNCNNTNYVESPSQLQSSSVVNDNVRYNASATSYRYIEPGDPRVSYTNFEDSLARPGGADPSFGQQDHVTSGQYTSSGYSSAPEPPTRDSGSSHRCCSPGQRRVRAQQLAESNDPQQQYYQQQLLEQQYLQHQQQQQQQQGYNYEQQFQDPRYQQVDQQQPHQQQQHYSNQHSNQQPMSKEWFSSGAPSRSQTDDDLFANRIGPGGHPSVPSHYLIPDNTIPAGPAGRRQRRRRLSSYDARTPLHQGMENSFLDRNDALVEGQRMLMESLREKVAALEERCEKSDREKATVVELLTAKKSDYERMKEHYTTQLNDADDELLRLKSEKARLLDKLQLPESERASLAAEENVIAELRRRLEEEEGKQGDVLSQNEQLRREVTDLQLEMAEMHDQFREEEAIEFRELQKELEGTAKNCRILQFKLRKAERRVEQLESDRGQYEDKIRHYESCIQSSDDKRRIRVLEEDLRMSKEVSVRMHEELEKQGQRRIRLQEDVDRLKNQLNDADNRRLCVQNELDSVKHEYAKLQEERKYDSMKNFPKQFNPSVDGDVSMKINQLSRDLAASQERETDLREQLKFAEEQANITRNKLSDIESENETLALQIRKLSSTKSGKFGKVKAEEEESETMTQKESEMKFQMEMAEDELKVVKRKLDEVQQDNDNLLCAVKYLRGKLEGSNQRCNTPLPEVKTTKDLLASIIASTIGCTDQKFDDINAELAQTNEKLAKIETENARLIGENVKLISTAAAKPDAAVESLQELKEKLDQSVKEASSLRFELDSCRTQLKTGADDLAKSKKDYDSKKNKLKKANEELEQLRECKVKLETLQKTYDDLKSQHDKISVKLAQRCEELRAATEWKVKTDDLQQKYNKLKEEFDKASPKESQGKVSSKDKEPAGWKFEKQELERQAYDFKKKYEDLQTEVKKSAGKIKKLSSDDSAKSDDLKSEVKKKDEEIKALTNERQKLQTDLDALKKKLKKSEETWEKEKSRLETALKAAEEKLSASSGKKTATTDDESKAFEALTLSSKTLAAENKTLSTAKEKLTADNEKLTAENRKLSKERKSLSDEVNELRKEINNLTAVWRKEKEELQAKISAKSSSISAACKSCEKLKEEIESLKIQGSSNFKSSFAGSTSGSKVTSIPLDTKVNSLQRSSRQDSSDSSETETERLLRAEKASMEERFQSRTAELEEILEKTREQMSSLKSENESLTKEARKTLTDLKKSFEKAEKELASEREELNRRCKAADQTKEKLLKLEKSLEEASSKLKAEEAKKREIENKLKIIETRNSTQENEKSDKSSKPTETSDDKDKTGSAASNKKAAEFLNKFEKFGGGTPRPVRRLSVPNAPDTSPGKPDQGGKASDVLGEFQKQLSEVEKARLSDRQELLEKIDKQKTEFMIEIESLKKQNSQLEGKAKELTTVQKELVEAHCKFEEERGKWSTERSKLQTKVDEAEKLRKGDRDKVIDLSVEIKRLQVLCGENSTSISSKSSPSKALVDGAASSSTSPSNALGKPKTSTAPEPSKNNSISCVSARKFGSTSLEDKKNSADSAKNSNDSASTAKVDVGKLGSKFGKSSESASATVNSVKAAAAAVNSTSTSASSTSAPAKTSILTSRFNRTSAVFNK